MGVITKTIYDTDFVEWTSRTAALVRDGRFDEVDLEHLAEEIEDLGKSDRSAVQSHLTILLTHLVKQRMQPEREGSSWRRTIVEQRRMTAIKLEQSPSLRRFLEDKLQRIYRDAVKDAESETGMKAKSLPAECPYTLDQLLNEDLFE